jgi:Fungal protein kinase
MKNDWLPRFFWCLSHADGDTRGIDKTFIPVTDTNESCAAREALRLGDDDPLYKVSVHDDATKAVELHTILSAAHLQRNHIYPIGRGTRCFVAFDCQSQKIILLKDTQRVNDYMKEEDVYSELRQENVENIAGLLASGDVRGVNHACGVTLGLVRNQLSDRAHIHYCLILDTVGSSITSFSSTWQVVRAVFAALRGAPLLYHFIELRTQRLDSSSRCSHEMQSRGQGYYTGTSRLELSL